MVGLSDLTEISVLNALLRNLPLQVATPYVALHTSDPGDGATATEVSDGGYVRKLASFPQATSGTGVTQNSADITFGAVQGAGYTVTFVSIWTAVSAGTMLMSQALNTSKAFAIGDVPRFPAGSLTVTAS